jgi:RNA polymerase sigma factor (sigma-70 family)
MLVTHGDEADMLAGIMAGDQDVIAAFDKRVRPRLQAFARRRGLRPQDAADVAQETLVAAIRQVQHRQFQGRGTLTAWIWGIFDRRVSDFLRKRGRDDRAIVSLDPAAFDALPSQERAGSVDVRVLVHETLLVLSSRERLVLLLNMQDGRSAREIASMLRLGTKTTEAVLTRAKHRFRKLIAAAQDDGAVKQLGEGRGV